MLASSQVLLGIILGYVFFSIFESIAHKYLLHAKRRTRIYWHKLGYLGKYINNSWFSHHVVHHHKTFRTNHVTLFDSKQQEKELNQLLIENNKREIIHSSYGLRIGNIYEKIRYLYPHFLWLLIVCYAGGGYFTLGILVPLFFYIWIAEYVHPYIHLPYRKAIDIASPIMRLVIKTKYFKYLARHHYLHHKYLNCNFSLMLGADWFLGCHRLPNEIDLIEMSNLGLE
ncbi:hypothetical protein [Nitrosomonas sp. Nm166]|uniref:hypothetical protein n=1 Tax=Nitrosomonas sp. Nm166 TaxID=1881054 RepID=UPI0008EFA749|nr:hypothetical protein [Nitrosomonas sp. Nm166]SFE21309.1 hypothetical protein SAMN05428977_100968 [Nitrosomonas sp. Nm166]